MHPLIRILCFMIAVIMLARANLYGLLLMLVLALLVLLFSGRARMVASVRLVWRMKWLWISLLVVFFWMTPGDRMMPAWGAWSPVQEGVEEGLYRVAYLLLCVLLAQLVVLSMQPQQLLAAVYQLSWPLQLFGDFRARFAVRFSLTLDVIGRLEQFLKMMEVQTDSGYMRRASQRLSQAWTHAVANASAASLEAVETGNTDRVPLYQWLLPPLLVAGLLMLSRLQ